MRPARAAALLLAATAMAGAPGRARAQTSGLRWYLLDVAAAADSSGYGPAAATNLARIRLMDSPRVGPVAFDLAYESFVSLTSAHATTSLVGGLGQPVGAEWLPLQATITSGSAGSWRHRLDRLSAQIGSRRVELTVGRQAISWATTLFLTPADPFAPFDPADPFREYRAGVDAARVRVFPARFAEVEAAARVADTPSGRKVTAAARGYVSFGQAELSAWGGTVAGEPAGAVGATFGVAGAVLRGEAELRRDQGRSVLRTSVGADRSVELAGHTFYAMVEYQHDGFGAASAAEIPAVAASAAAARGDLQVLGRDEAAAQATYQIHPLVSLELLGLVNLGDGSALLAPAVSWSATGAVTVRAGVFAGLGASAASVPTAPRSEYGPSPLSVYAAVSAIY